MSLGSNTQMSPEDIRLHNEGVLTSCTEGDLLEFPRGKISHWGVYAGDGRVIHRTGDNNGSSGFLRNPLSSMSSSGVKLDKAEVREDSFWDVVRDSLAKINNYLDRKKAAMPGWEIVRRARSKIGEVGYNALWKNCEHFATWCRYGEETSKQAIIAALLFGVLGVSFVPLLNVPVGLALIVTAAIIKVESQRK